MNNLPRQSPSSRELHRPQPSSSVADVVARQREGVPAAEVAKLADRLGLTQKRLLEIIGLPASTATRKLKDGGLVDGLPGVAVLAIEQMIERAQTLLHSAGSDDARGFDVAGWFGRWIEQPMPALAGARPSDYLDTPAGQEVVFRLLGAMESGAYV